jgi:hypothetical protein
VIVDRAGSFSGMLGTDPIGCRGKRVGYAAPRCWNLDRDGADEAVAPENGDACDEDQLVAV